MQDIDVHGEFKNCAVTLLVMSKFLNLPGASRACLDFRDPIDFSRFNSGNMIFKLKFRTVSQRYI